MGYIGTTFATLFLLTIVFFSATTPSTAQTFKCTSSANCTSLVGYVSPNATTISHIQSFFNVKNLRAILGANNLPDNTTSDYAIQANETVRIPVSCHCINNTGVARNMPVYKVVQGDILYDIATKVFAGLVTYQRIAEVNKLTNESLIEIGQSLSIPLPCSCDDVNGQKVVHYDHVVQPGSSLDEIAEKFGTDKQTLMDLNGIVDEKRLLAYQPLDVPLRACSSSIRNDSIDSALHVANDTYVFTASNCVKCKCDAANNWTLRCSPSGLQLPNNQICPSMACSGSNSFLIGNISSDGCSICAYAGYSNQAILTNTTTNPLSTCTTSDNENAGPRMGPNWNCFFISIHLVLLYLYLSH